MKRDQSIVLMLAGLLAGCKSTSEFGLNENRMNQTRNLISTTVSDPERSKAMLAIVDSLQRKVREVESKALVVRDRLTEANRNYDTSRPELEQLYAKLGELTVQLGNTAKTHSLELRALCSQEEWGTIAAHKTEALHFTF